MYFSVQMSETEYDVFMCSVDYEGDANLPYVTYSAFDGYTNDWPYDLDFEIESSGEN